MALNKSKAPAKSRGFACFSIFLRGYGMDMHRPSQPLHEVIRWPGPGKLHMAIFQLLAGAGVLVLITLNTFVVNQVSDVEQHLAGIHPAAADLLVKWAEHPMHLH